MTNGIGIWRCSGCGATYFPERLLCAHCHSAAFDRARVEEGVVEEITVIRHVLGQTEWQPKRVANVRTLGGPLMTVGLIDDAQVGSRIALFEEGTAPFGRKLATG